MEKFIININKKIFNEKTAQISVLDRGFLYGDSVYEATRTFNRTPFQLDEHIDRLFFSASKIYLNPTYTKEEIHHEVNKTLVSSPYDNVSIRIILTRGDNSDIGLDPDLASLNNLIIMTKEIKPNPTWWYTDGVSMVFYQKQTSNTGPLPKAGNYIENMLAYREAKEKKAHDAIMINPEGFITESTTSNIWLVKNGKIQTPALSAGVLEGITRKTMLRMLPYIEEKNLTKEDFLMADECFITSTTRDLVPVISINNQKIGDGTPGKETLKLLSLYRAYVRKDR